MLFQILDVDYTLVDEKPVIRIFGKGEKGETVCGFFENYEPYFYVMGKDVEDRVKNESNVVRIENVRRFLPLGYQTEMVEMQKVILRNPAKTPEIRNSLLEEGFKVFEADIPFKYRFMADFGLKGMEWVEIEETNGVTTNTVSTDKKIKIKDFKKVEMEGVVPMKFLALDIECISMKGGEMPDSRKDPIIMISLVFSEPYKGKEGLVMSTRSDKDVLFFEDEKEMLKGLIDMIMDYDPDMITGFNINNFDFPYILDRMKENEVYANFGRCKKQVMKNQVMNKFKINIAGRVIVDSFEIAKRDFSLKRYNLDTVAGELIGEKKDPIKQSQIEKFWKGDQEKFRRLVSYSKKDSRLALDLLLKLNLLDKYTALSKVSGTLLQDILDSGETTRIENLILREFNKEGYVLPCRPDGSEVSRREKLRKIELKGGYVIEPDKGLHSSVLVLDFRSMYPSLIRTFNICPTTLILGDDIEGSVKSPSGARFVPENVRKGIIPRILEHLMDERSGIKKVMIEEEESERIREMKAKEFALKIMSNAFYGHFGYPRAKVYSLDIANSITAFGRDTIKKTREYIEKKFGYKVVYGDTDSVMIKVPFKDLEKMRKAGGEVSKSVTSLLKGIMELEFEKVFKRFLPLTKKRYAAWYFEMGKDGWKDGIETKGIETVRRDWCDLTSETIKRVLDIILKKNDIKLALEYFKSVVDDMVAGKIPIQKLVITKTMTKRAEGYVGIQPHAELAKKIQKRSPAEAPGVGDRIGYVITKGLELLSKRTEDPLYVIEKGLEIDSKYYIENQLLPPLERVFIALGISKTELLGKGKQVDLLGAINGLYKKANEVKEVEEVPINEVKGFVCKKCYKTYSIPPLSGVCECGGPLLFSSSMGPAKQVILQ
ncbi:MAG: DNA-directed DNA polymerase [Candidatus Aenigmarchaeota archaeon]